MVAVQLIALLFFAINLPVIQRGKDALFDQCGIPDDIHSVFFHDTYGIEFSNMDQIRNMLSRKI